MEVRKVLKTWIFGLFGVLSCGRIGFNASLYLVFQEAPDDIQIKGGGNGQGNQEKHEPEQDACHETGLKTHPYAFENKG